MADVGSTRTGDRVVAVTDCGVDTGDSGLAAHIAAVFFVALISAAGFLFPILTEFFSPSSSSSKEGDGDGDGGHGGHHHHLKHGRRHVAVRALFACCQFGATAVLLNVGFVHTLGDAGDHLSSPCLPDSFTSAFPDWSVLTASAAIMAMMLLDHATLGAVERLAERDRDRAASASAPAAANGNAAAPSATATLAEAGGIGSPRRSSRAINLEPAVSGWSTVVGNGAAYDLNDTVSVAVSKATGGGCHHPLPTGGSERYRRAVVALVEATVCSHSVPVGLALGLQKGNGFLSLAIAICLHQFLEGFAVGAAVLKAGYSRGEVAACALFFSLTAPFGIALGAGLRSVLNPNSSAFLLTVGFVNAIAAGMLIYVALRHVNAFDSQAAYLRGEEHGEPEGSEWWVTALCVASFVGFGAAVMVIGKWA